MFPAKIQNCNLMELSLMDSKLTLTLNILLCFQHKHVLYMEWISILYQTYTLKSERQNNIAVLQILLGSSSQQTCALDFFYKVVTQIVLDLGKTMKSATSLKYWLSQLNCQEQRTSKSQNKYKEFIKWQSLPFRSTWETYVREQPSPFLCT